jgi:hypothetical protein
VLPNLSLQLFGQHVTLFTQHLQPVVLITQQLVAIFA